MPYRYSALEAQMGCDLAVCDNPAVGYVSVRLKDQSLGGIREVLHLAVCAEHTSLGTPVERTWKDGTD